MNAETKKIICPSCGHDIDVNEILYRQLDEELKKKYHDELTKERLKFKQQEEILQIEKEKIEMDKKNIQNLVAEQIQAGLKEEKIRLEAILKKKILEEQGDEVAALKSELDEKNEKVKELIKTRSEIEKLKREKDELRDTIELETQQKLNIILNEEKDRIQKNEEAKATMRISEKDLVINQLKEKLQEAQRQAEQGSMQRQGEAQELVIEEWLSGQFPLDTVVEIKKGAQGADCLQIVNTRGKQNCGSIYYESKRTKNFQPAWIEKFKKDIRDKNADIGVLVTEVMPLDMERMGLKDGVWICTYEEFKGLCTVLRESIVQISSTIATQENKGEKMGMLYDFLTSNEFRLQIEAIVEGFTIMQADLESEKRAMQGIWKKREKQIDKVLLNTNHMYNSIRGIAGNAVGAIPLLELGESDESNDREERSLYDESNGET